MPMEPPNTETQKSLVDLCLLWVERLARINKDAKLAFDAASKEVRSIDLAWLNSVEPGAVNSIEEAFDRVFEKPYLIALAVKQVHSYLNLILPFVDAETQTVAIAFNDAYSAESVNDLRNHFEHEAERVVGHQPKWVKINKPKPDIEFSLTEDSSGIRVVSIFGVEYQLKGAIEAALNLRNGLITFRQTLNQSPTS